jgi:hypothetical protein
VFDIPFPSEDDIKPGFNSIGAQALDYGPIDAELEKEFKTPSTPCTTSETKERNRKTRTESRSKGLRSKKQERPKSAALESLSSLERKPTPEDYVERRKTIQLMTPGALLDYQITSYNSAILT